MHTPLDSPTQGTEMHNPLDSPTGLVGNHTGVRPHMLKAYEGHGDTLDINSNTNNNDN
jgi:hypothetical protein